MTYQEIYDDVVSITNHPEMASEIATAIKASTLRTHQSDFYSRDIAEQSITLSASGYLQTITISPSFVRFRALKYVRKWDPTGIDPLTGATGTPGIFFKKLDPDAVIDGYGYHKNNVYYVAGTNINIRSDTPISAVLAGWYQNPIISPVGQYASWIADLVPHAIIFDACSFIFQMVAQNEQSRKFDALVAEQMQLVRQHGLEGVGY